VSPKASSRPRFHAPFLDGLRGFASICVVYGHLSMHMLGYRPEYSFDKMAGYGVTIFFVLSAFLLTIGAGAEWSALSERAHTKADTAKLWGRYFVRRFFRIYPAYFYVVLLATYAVPLAYLNMERPDMLFGNLTLSEAHWILWAIPIECEYYFVIPILVVLYQRARTSKRPDLWRRVLYAAIVVVGAISARRFGDKYLPDGSMLWIHLPRRLWEFLSGSMAAFLYMDLRDRNALPESAKVRRLFDVLALACLAMIFLALPHYSKAVFNIDGDWSWPYLSSFVAGMVLFGLLSHEGLLTRGFSWVLLKRAGQISFSTYLLHPLGFYLGSHLCGGFIPIEVWRPNEKLDQIMIGWLCTAILAYASFWLVEKRGMLLGTRINRKWLGGAAESAT